MARFRTLRTSERILNVYSVSRRRWLAWASLAIPFAERCDAYSSGFWNRKDPAAWSAEEVRRLLNNSPWARPVTAASGLRAEASSASTRVPTPSEGSGGTGRGGGRGGGTLGSNGRPRVRDDGGDSDVIHPEHQYPGIVRWESAAPVRMASTAALPAAFAGHYVLSLNGFPMGDTVTAAGVSQLSVDNLTRIAAASFLIPKGKAGSQARMAQTVDGAVLLGFARHPLSVENHEVEFSSMIGHLALRAKFHLREMIFRDGLAL